MNKKLKVSILLSIGIIIITSIIISTFFIVKHLINKRIIEKVISTYSDDNIQERLKNQDDDNPIALEINGETTIGVIKISKIGFEGLIYEGTSLSTLAKGVGHFSNSPYLNGNVCLAAHNTKKFWAKLHTVEIGDTIFYTSLLGSKEYIIDNIQIIDENNLSVLENTDTNRITLITCVLNNPSKRLCVQAHENVNN